MIAHLVLFKPKAGLSPDDRRALVDALQHALNNIPLIKRARVGRRIVLGRPYDAHNVQDFPFAAILEFESESDLQDYLNHPAHASLGQQFYLTSEAALAFDFELIPGNRAGELL